MTDTVHIRSKEETRSMRAQMAEARRTRRHKAHVLASEQKLLRMLGCAAFTHPAPYRAPGRPVAANTRGCITVTAEVAEAMGHNEVINDIVLGLDGRIRAHGPGDREPIRKPKTSPNRDSFVGDDGRTYKQFRFGEVLKKELPEDAADLSPFERERLLNRALTPIQPFVEFFPVHGPRVPKDRAYRGRQYMKHDAPRPQYAMA